MRRVLRMARCTNVPRLGHLALCSGVARGRKDLSNEIVNRKQNEMKKEENEVRKHFVKTRMNEAELHRLKSLLQKTTEKDISAYLRKVALQKPVTFKYRNQSADDFLKDMLALKKELNGIGNNFNQAVHKLHLLDKIPEFRNWINQYDSLQKTLVSKVAEINLRINQLYEEWLQK